MSKDEQKSKLKEIIIIAKKTCADLRFHEKNNLKFHPKDAVYAPNENEYISEAILDAGFRDITGLRDWLKERTNIVIKDESKTKEFNDGYEWGKSDVIKTTLKKLEEL